MSIATETGTDQSILEVIELEENLSESVPCDIADEECDKEATWRGTQVCCNNRANLCDEHRQRFLDRVRYYTLIYGGVSCVHCGSVPMPEATWRPL